MLVDVTKYTTRLLLVKSHYNSELHFGQPISLGTSQIPVVINIPPEAFNIGNAIMTVKSFVEFAKKPNGSNK
jgi:hypothetical protein